MPGGGPIGNLESAVASVGSATLTGWVLDPDTAASSKVAIYRDGIGLGWFDAAATRLDVAAAFLGYGHSHGFALTVPAAVGAHRFCVYAVNVGTGSANTTLGCRSVTVAH